MVDVEKEADGLADDFGSLGAKVALSAGIKSLCAKVREEERKRCAEMVKGSLAHFEAADRIADQILAAPSPGSGPVQKENCKHESTWFDREIALRSNGKMGMATICNDCGKEI